jgi:hypothetical protein
MLQSKYEKLRNMLLHLAFPKRRRAAGRRPRPFPGQKRRPPAEPGEQCLRRSASFSYIRGARFHSAASGLRRIDVFPGRGFLERDWIIREG